MRVLITGAAGFAGGHLSRHLADAGHDVVGVGRAPESPVDFEYVTLDLRDQQAVTDTFERVAPDWIAHLAADASVGQSWKDPAGTMRKVYGFLGVDDRFEPDVGVRHNRSLVPRTSVVREAFSRPRRFRRLCGGFGSSFVNLQSSICIFESSSFATTSRRRSALFWPTLVL